MDLKTYFQTLENAQDVERSPLWRELGGRLRECAVNEGPAALLEKLPTDLAYHFVPQAQLKTPEKSAKAAFKARRDLDRVEEGLREQIKTFRNGLEYDLESLAAWAFIKHHELLEPYEAMLDELKIQHDYGTARHFYYFTKLQNTLKSLCKTNLNVLEIGAGAGNLSILLHKAGLVKSYTIIDLPEMLALSAISLKSFGHTPKLLEAPTGEAGEVILTTPERLESIPTAHYDLILNFNSFSEMEKTVVDNYFEHIYRWAAEDALFYNVNRIQLHDQNNGSKWAVNPLLFPYQPSDRILELDMDQFQVHVMNYCRPSINSRAVISRMAVVHPTAR